MPARLVGITVSVFKSGAGGPINDAQIFWDSEYSHCNGFKSVMFDVWTDEECTLRIRAPGYRSRSFTWIDGIKGPKSFNIELGAI